MWFAATSFNTVFVAHYRSPKLPSATSFIRKTLGEILLMRKVFKMFGELDSNKEMISWINY
ncbi:hypothetical protein DRN50_04915 [Thermococci archaeon]|nr:MAG: hypothetical protein DRN50_04915 [Thermococci archaeon]